MQLFRNLHRLFAFILRFATGIPHARAILTAVIVAGVVNGLGNMVLVAVVNHAINADGSGGRGLAWIFLGVCAVLPVARYLSEFLLIFLSERATFQLRMSMTGRILAAPLRSLEEMGTPRLLATLTNDIPAVVGTFSILPLLCMNLAIVAGSLVYMGVLSGQLLLGVFVFLAVGVLGYQLPLHRAQGHVRALRERVDLLFGHFRALTEGIKELKLSAERRRAFLEEELEHTAVELQAHNVAAHRLFTASVSWGQVLVFLVIGLLAFVVPRFTPVEPVVLTGYVLAILYIVTPIQVVMNSMPQLSRAVVAMERVERLGLELGRDASAAPPRLSPPPASWRSLELDGVTHAYYAEHERTTFTLGPLHLAFRPGEIVFVTGGNGSGKTTLAKLLTGLYRPESGEIRVDGAPVAEDGIEGYHRLFSVVFSDFHLFDRLLGVDTRDLDAQARRYLALLQLDHKVGVEEGKLSTTELSQGQRKRLALLAAYLEDRPIYLFDEWAADQDPVFKEVFYHQLLPQLKERGKTVIAISHDDRYFHVADRRIKLEYGQVVEDTARLRLDSEPLVAVDG
ncbi:MAG TPA: cyclic peptide export ABC transporter [Longimicrobiaceae bacterium]|nr:cyclic peptide export ABC transporter [Longimicrobiaceae bacterium]